jgi:hypothetical protein
MTVNFTDSPITAPSPAVTSRAFRDRLGRGLFYPHKCVNVLDFGADNTGGSGDSGPAIQNALTAAFGGANWFSPNNTKNGQNWKNLAVYFPAGTYNIKSQINILGVRGVLFFGDGMDATVLKWAAMPPGGSVDLTGVYSGTAGTMTNMFLTNGFASATIRDLCIDMGGPWRGSLLADGTCGFNWNWDGGVTFGANNVDQQTTYLQIINCKFTNATFGWCSGPNFPATLPPNGTSGPGGNTGQECDTAIFIGCVFTSCYRGLNCLQANVLAHDLYGGTVSNCVDVGIYTRFGLSHVAGVTFSGNGGWDIETFFPMFISGCILPSGVLSQHTGCYIIDCASSSGGIAFSAAEAGSQHCIVQCPVWGVQGGGDVEMRDVTLTSGTPFGSFTGHLTWHAPTSAFASLPTGRVGMQANITDSNTAAFGVAIAGGGTNYVLGRFNGTNWTVMGA